nr:helicase-related protein [Lentilactobacillus parafarraginis]
MLFVPTIQDLQRVGAAISREKIRCRYETVFSADPKRLEKVAAMRSRSLDFLITTTILERGVTFPGIDVLVLKADDRIFSSAALVQIAGRVGRNTERPGGQVLLYCSTRSSSVKACDRQIKQMNQKARQLS